MDGGLGRESEWGLRRDVRVSGGWVRGESDAHQPLHLQTHPHADSHRHGHPHPHPHADSNRHGHPNPHVNADLPNQDGDESDKSDTTDNVT